MRKVTSMMSLHCKEPNTNEYSLTIDDGETDGVDDGETDGIDDG